MARAIRRSRDETCQFDVVDTLEATLNTGDVRVLITQFSAINALAEDRQGCIWVGGRDGLSVYDSTGK